MDRPVLKHSSPPPLPETTPDLLAKRVIKAQRTLNDMVEELIIGLWEDEEFQRYLYAVYDEQAVEGSLGADNIMAAHMIRDRAVRAQSPIAKEKLATISKSMGVVLRRYESSRKERRDTVGGEIVSSGSSTNGD